MRLWWSGTRLVTARVLTESVASRSWRITTAIMLLLGIAIVVVPRLIGPDTTTYRLATVGQAPPEMVTMLQAAGAAGGFQVEVSTVADDAAAQAAVRDGEVGVALTDPGPGGTLYVAADSGGTFPALVSQAALTLSQTAALRDAGLTPEQIATVAGTAPPQQVTVGRVTDETRAGIGFVVGIVLYLALIVAGAAIATAVATEKASRISEVLLAVLRPTQLLVGTVLGTGLLMVVQVAALAVPALIGVSGNVNVPASSSRDIGLALLWLVLGLALYAFIFAALGALVDKPTEVGSAILPANAVLIGSYLLAVTVTMSEPGSPASVAASLFPLSAPMVMPIRWASGLVPGWQLALAMLLTGLTAVAVAWFAARVYARGLTLTGRRVKLGEALTH